MTTLKIYFKKTKRGHSSILISMSKKIILNKEMESQIMSKKLNKEEKKQKNSKNTQGSR